MYVGVFSILLPANSKLFVHCTCFRCSAGIGRTGTFIIVDLLLNKIAREGAYNIGYACTVFVHACMFTYKYVCATGSVNQCSLVNLQGTQNSKRKRQTANVLTLCCVCESCEPPHTWLNSFHLTANVASRTIFTLHGPLKPQGFTTNESGPSVWPVVWPARPSHLDCRPS